MGARIDPRLIPNRPNFKIEKQLWQEGLRSIAGLDEAGRGALAGPVYAAACIFAPDGKAFRKLKGVRDSKEMSQAAREFWHDKVLANCLAYGIGEASAQEIDEWGIVPATQGAMERAIRQLQLKAEHLLIDALVLPENPLPQTKLIKGDQRSLSIAAASVLAKVARDQAMRDLAEQYPAYGFTQHKGYGTLEHRRQLDQLGPSKVHRLSFDWKAPN
mgnify:CR=1 FL=1